MRTLSAFGAAPRACSGHSLRDGATLHALGAEGDSNGGPTRLATLVAALLCIVQLTGCSLAGRRGEPSRPASSPATTPMPPQNQKPPDIDAIPDAVPKFEPRSKRGNPPFYSVAGKRYYVLASADGFVERGVASWYGPTFHGGSTSIGESYDMYGMTAAHKTLPLPAYARVTNLKNGKSVVVRVNDRGPFVSNRIIDLSYTAAAKLDMLKEGTTLVEVRALTPSTPDTITRTAEQPPSELYVQAGAFADPGNAQRLADKLRAAGLGNVSIAPPPPDGRSKLSRVRIGPIENVPEFDRIAKQLVGLGVPDARLATD
jgi:rare lipoprotein A